jgi:hypothetical protein
MGILGVKIAAAAQLRQHFAACSRKSRGGESDSLNLHNLHKVHIDKTATRRFL